MNEAIQTVGTKAVLRLAALNVALWLVCQGLSEALAPWGIGLYLGALYITLPALVMPYHIGMIWGCIWGLWADAYAVWPFGLSSLLWTAAFTGIALIRNHLSWPAFREGLWISVILNTLLVVIFGILAKPALVSWAIYGLLLASTWLISTTILLILVWPMFHLQMRALGLSTLTQKQHAEVYWS